MHKATPVFRFAPSPNGYLHLGHAFSALFTQEMARRHDGQMLLRIEDIDAGRSRPEFEAAIYEDLAWLGIAWEQPVRRQSDHFDDYVVRLAQLDGAGLVYPCFATRREIADAVAAKGALASRDPDGAPLYPGLCRDLPEDERQRRIAADEPYTLRLDMAAAIGAAKARGPWPIRIRNIDADGGDFLTEAQPERWGDVVLARKDVPTSYHIAVVTDDAIQGITHVTRGLDLLAATDIHRLLQRLLGLPEPVYCHHRLIVDADGRKLSKSLRDKSVRSLRSEGAQPQDIKRMVGFGGDL